MSRSAPALAALAAALFASTAEAHTGVGPTTGFVHGFLHPLGGADHLLAMLAVGMLAFLAGGRALWLLPASFVATMATGGVLATLGFAVAGIEPVLALSVVVIAGLAATGRPLPLSLLAPLVAGFALFHGLAHGAETPADASGLAYGAGFIAATVFLHLSGLAAAALALRAPRPSTVSVRLAAAAMSVAGLVMLAGRL